MSKLRILLADDHQLFREGLRCLIDSQPDMQMVGEASTGTEAVQKARQLKPDIVLMDLTMPELNGLQATKHIKAQVPEIKVVALTAHEDETYLRQLIQAQASGYVLKRAAANELVQAVRAVAAGELYFDRALAAKALVAQALPAATHQATHTSELSEREKEVVIFVAWGYSNKEIAAKLGVSVKSVETYRTRTAEKLGLRSRTEVVRFALREGWLKDAPPGKDKA